MKNDLYKEYTFETIKEIFGNDKFYINLFKNLLDATINNDFSNISNTPKELINEYNNIYKQTEKYFKSLIYEPIYSSTAYDGLIQSLIQINSVYNTITYLRKNITEFTIQPDEVIDNYLDSFGFPGKDLFNYIQKRQICKSIYWYLRRKGTPELIIKLLNILGFSNFFLANYNISEGLNEDINDNINNNFNIHNELLLTEDYIDHILNNDLIYENNSINEEDLNLYQTQKHEYNELYLQDALCLSTEEDLNRNNKQIIYPSQSSYYQLSLSYANTNSEKIASAFIYAASKKIKNNYYANSENLYTCKVQGYNNKTSILGLVLGYTYLLGEYFGIKDNDLYEPYDIKEIYDDKIKYDIGPKNQKKEFLIDNEKNIIEYDGRYASTKNSEYSNINFNGGHCGLIFYEYNGYYASYKNKKHYSKWLDLDGGSNNDTLFIYDGGDSYTTKIDYIKYYDEYNNGEANTNIFDEDIQYNGGFAVTEKCIFMLNCGYSFNKYYKRELNNAFAGYINNNEYNGGDSRIIKFQKKQLNNGNALSTYYPLYIKNDISYNKIYDNGYAYSIINPSIINFNYEHEFDLLDASYQLKKQTYNIDINGGDSIIRPNEIYFFNKDHDNGFANTFISENKDIDNFYKNNGFTWAQYDKGEIYRSELSEIYSTMNNFHMRTQAKTEWEKRFDMDLIIDNIGNIWDSNYIIDKNFEYEDLYNFTFYKVKYPVFGWRKNIEDVSLIEIMNDIHYEINRLTNKLLWLPDIHEKRENTLESEIMIEKDNIKVRRDNNLREIKDIFYSPPLYGIYEDAISDFKDHDLNFKNYIDILIDEKNNIVNNNKITDKEKNKKIANNFNKALDLINSILESIEYFIFDNTGYTIPIRNIFMNYSRIMEIIEKIDKYYTPYHSKLLFPMVFSMIEDYPGDQIAIDDSQLINTSRINLFKDLVWRANHYSLYDIAPPEPYDPISDFNGANNNMPHIPVSNYYQDEYTYNNDQLQKENPNLYSIGYNWTNLNENNLIVRNNCLEPIYDWDPDYMRMECTKSIIDTIDICRPIHNDLNKILEKELKIKKNKMYMNVYTATLMGSDKYDTYNIKHDLNSYDIFVEAYNDIGLDKEIEIERLNNNIINIKLNYILPKGKKIKILIMAPHSTNNDPCNYLSSERHTITGNGYLNYFMVLHNFSSKNIYYNVYNRITGNIINTLFRRVNDNMVYIGFNNPPNNDYYKLNLININENNNNKIYPSDTLYYEYIINNAKENKEYRINHNFYTNNIIVRAYNLKTLKDVKINVKFIDVDNLTIEFIDIPPKNNYKIILMCALGIPDPMAIPLNNISGFMGSFSGDDRHRVFVIHHNMNTLNTYEQIIDFYTGEYVKVYIERIDENSIKVEFNKPPKKSNRYIAYIFAEMNINTLTYPSTYLNTSLLQFKLLNACTIDDCNNNIEDVEYTEILNEYDAQDSLAINPIDNDVDNYFSKIPQVRLSNTHKLKNITNEFAPDYIARTFFTRDRRYTCDCKYCRAINPTDYIIEHNIGNKNVITQIYNKYGQKVSSYTKILDDNHILVSFKRPIPLCEHYNVNILSIPDTSVPLKEYNNIKYNKKSFIGSYCKELPIYEKYVEVESITIDEFDGGFATTPEEKYIKTLNNGFSDTLIILFKQNYDGGDALVERVSYYNTFTVNHNLNSNILIVNIYDINTRETIDCYISINDKNNITIGFKEPPLKTDRYTVIIIALLPYKEINDYLEKDVDYTESYKEPHFNREIIVNLNENSSIHTNIDTDFYDQPEEYINIYNEKENQNIRYNLQTYDLPTMREKIEIIHEIKGTNIYNYASENNGFNDYKIIVNDKSYGNEPYNDVDYTTTTFNTYETFKKNMGIE